MSQMRAAVQSENEARCGLFAGGDRERVRVKQFGGRQMKQCVNKL